MEGGAEDGVGVALHEGQLVEAVYDVDGDFDVPVVSAWGGEAIDDLEGVCFVAEGDGDWFIVACSEGDGPYGVNDYWGCEGGVAEGDC